MNKEIELLNKKIEAQDKIINTQALEIARLKSKCEILEENNKLLIQQKSQMYEDLDIAYDKIDKAKEDITSYESADTLMSYENKENNKGLDEKTMIEINRRYLIIQRKLLEILGDKE